MKLVFTALIMISSLSAYSQNLYPYPGQDAPPSPYPSYPGNGDGGQLDSGQPVYPPSQPYPPPYTNSQCKLEFTGSYYYVSKDGSRFTDLTSNMQQALQQKQQLENQGMCRAAVNAGSCQLEYTGSYYYVSRSGSRFTELVTDYISALRSRDQLYQSRNCDQNTYQPHASCKIEYTGSYYYVSRNGSRFSNLVSDLNSATRTRDDFARNYVCQVQYQSAPCRLEFTGSYYYLSINSTRASELNSNLNVVLNQQNDFSNRGLCSQPNSNDRCSLEYTGSYYYVARNGSRISQLVSSMSQASQTMNQLQYSRNCY